jgi:hypothetical protein
MHTKIDLKSALCGLALGVLALFAVGATDTPSHPIGRYQCSAAIDLLLIVDTTTGQAWAIRPGNVSITGAPAGFFDKKVDSSSNPVGRYQGSAAIDLLLIVDTTTGQAWAWRAPGLHSITGSPGGFFDKKVDK